MKSLMFLWRAIADDLAMGCYTSAALDYKKLESRVEDEGVSFLTITLPEFGKAFEKALESGFWDPSLLTGFRHKGGLPLFLGGFLDRIFSRSTGRLLDEPCVDSIFAIRQLTLMFKKILLPCSDIRVEGAMQSFIQCEQEVKSWTWRTDEDREEFISMSRILWSDVLSEVDREIYDGELIPRHGPGATADRLTGNRKYDQTEWPRRLEEVFPYVEYALPNLRYALEVDRVTFLEPDAERPVKVTPVPKTLKTPRIIAIEPTCMQFMQQAVKNALVQKLEANRVGRNSRQNLAYGFVGFSSQDPNREMARVGSRDRLLATLDMSEASDRVSNEHVIALLSEFPHLSEAVQAVRSTKALVPTKAGDVPVPLSKYASMGSALTFPLEAMVFCTLVFMGLQRHANRRFTRKDIMSFRGKVRVYGDDIIVPSDMVSSVITVLESFGMKVNTGKSFWNGKFRESCGGDYYDGHWVTPTYVRRCLPQSRTDVPEVVSMVSLRNQLYVAGLWKAVVWLDDRIKEVLPFFPIVEPTSPLLGRTSFLPYQAEKVSQSTFTPLVRGYRKIDRIPPSELDGFGALLKCLGHTVGAADEFGSLVVPQDHLERSGRPQTVNIKFGWRPPY